MKVFLCETIHEAAYKKLSEYAEIVSDWNRIGEVDALINRALQIRGPEMDRMPNLKVIAVHGTGTDGVDLDEAKRRGIRVVYAPHMNANAVAELNVGLLLSVCRNIVTARKVIENRQKEDAQRLLKGSELRGKTAGLIGLGAVGSKTASILGQGFGMQLLTYNPFITKEQAAEYNCQLKETPEDLLAASDVVFLSLPLNDSTRGMISEKRLRAMKPGAVLINTARGPLIDEDALYQVLKEGHLSGAASDVLCEEFPQTTHPLLSLDNFVVTPHIGANTDEALYTVGITCVDEIIDVMEGREPEYPVI